MSTALTVASASPLAEMGELIERANTYASKARASSTRRSYLSAFSIFETWCKAQGLCAMPSTPGTVAVYVSELAHSGRKVATIERTLAALAHAHRSRGHAWPKGNAAIGEVMAGIRREHGVAPTARKSPIEGAALLQLVGVLGEDLRGLRDRALLLLGWSGAFRRSELVSLNVNDVRETEDGMIVTLRRSKRDQDGRGFEKGIPLASDKALCAMRALRAWLAAANIQEGPLFRAIDVTGRVAKTRLCDKAVLLIVQSTAARAGLVPEALGGHSLRAGFCTTAAKNGRSLDAIMRHTGHQDERVARGYIRMATVFQGNALAGLL